MMSSYDNITNAEYWAWKECNAKRKLNTLKMYGKRKNREDERDSKIIFYLRVVDSITIQGRDLERENILLKQRQRLLCKHDKKRMEIGVRIYQYSQQYSV
ncbi:unnamed protein product [Paramecium octaurelia]|uniref:Uncharacterized protein n=1 Tax=Paramecium octaurelia TaxID=43137 RepID=A0A8S1YNC9_PAROT|nr:unnamed protein product [Paramecium octaurelia]